jgi:hypothetical protein
MRRAVCPTFAVATLVCAAMYETSDAAPIAPLPGIQARPGSMTLAYSPHSRRPYRIVVPLTRHYGHRPYWWPQGQYYWSPFGAIGVKEPELIG